jgi:DNA repair exonuclease SbcCD ATPase subunit
MIKSLHLRNYAKHKDLVIDFKKGLTTICGKNGGGKTLIVEAISFALFGVKELRGAKTDYSKDMSVELNIEIKNKPYKIVRTLDNCNINEVVVGTTECNKFLSALLGFGSDVYNFSVYSKQAELTRLTDVAPAERKACIDSLIGAKQIDNVIKIIRSRINEAKARVSAFQTTFDNLPNISLPEKPLVPREEAEEHLIEAKTYKNELETLQKTKHDLSRKLEQTPTVVSPTEPKNLLSESEIEKERRRIADVFLRRTRINTLNSTLSKVVVSDVELPSEEELNRQFTLAQNYNFVIPDCPRPSLSREDIIAEDVKRIRFESWKKSPQTVCPKCGHSFHSTEAPEESKYSEEELREQTKRHKLWAGIPDDAETREKPKWTLEELYSFRSELEHRKLRESLLAEKNSISTEGFETLEQDDIRLNDSENYWKKKHEADKANADKMMLMMRIENLDSEIKELVDELNELPPIVDLEQTVYAWTNYELQRNLFEQNEKTKQRVLADKEAAETEVERLGKALDGMTEFKRRVKTFVIPSLESVASQMISEMSAGELNRFEIDEDFDILLDGKKICLLSGSEKALANIALRLSLGRVLTKNVLSVFIGDELDASMSEERAEAVHSALLRLRKAEKVNQILVITHKELECDNEVRI